MKKTTLAHFAVLGTNFFFAMNYSLVKSISPSLAGPFAVNVLRVGLSIPLFWILWPFGNTRAGIRKEDLGRFILCAITGVALNQMLFVKGLTLTSTIHASLLILVTPILVTFFALWALKETFTSYKAVGLLLGVAGSVLLVMQKESGTQASDYLLGDLYIMLNSIFYAIYFILVKPLMEKYTALHVIRWVFTIGLLFILPFGWKETAAVPWHSFDGAHVAALVGIVVTGTFLAYYFNGYALRYLGAGITGAYIYTQPVFAVLIAILLLGESFTWQKLAAALLIFSGVYFVSFRKKKPLASEKRL